MLKLLYEAPETQLYKVRLEMCILSDLRGGNVETMNEIGGSWDDE